MTPLAGGGAWRAIPAGIALRVRATPRANSNAVRGLVEVPASGADGGMALSVATTAAPSDGAANKQIVAIVAKALGVPRSAVRVAAGATGRVKRVEVEGDAGVLAARLDELCRP